jgi:hypothetical protein
MGRRMRIPPALVIEALHATAREVCEEAHRRREEARLIRERSRLISRRAGFAREEAVHRESGLGTVPSGGVCN